MHTRSLALKLQKAYRMQKSLRILAARCGVSHEMLRKIIIKGDMKNITVSSYEKIEAGLKSLDANGLI